MKRKIVTGLVSALLIVLVVLFAGYVGTETPIEAGEATPEPTMEDTSEEDVTPEPKQTPSSSTEPVLAPGYKWYHDEEFGYKIAYPENWEKNAATSTDSGDDAVIFSDPDTGTSNVMVGTSLEYDMEALKAETEGGKEVVINGREGYEVIFQPMPPVKMKLVVFDVGNKYYMISCTAPTDTFNGTVDTFDNVINSFVIE